jgi:hypothetical protein
VKHLTPVPDPAELTSRAVSARQRQNLSGGDHDDSQCLLRVNCNLLQRLTIGDMNFGDHAPAPQIVVIIGFLAGFLERLVPDLLEKATNSTARKPRLAAKS